MIQAVSGNARRARRGRRRRLGRAGRAPTRRASGASSSINRPFAIYIGRIDENKGCKELFDYFQRYAATFPRGLDLVLVGNAVMPIPKHPRIHHLGYPVGRGQVRRAGRRGPADHAVVLREPVDGGARGLGARPAGARQRPLRRAQGTVHPQQRRAVLRELRGVRRGAVLARVERAAARPARAERPRVLPPPLRVAGDRAQVSRHARAARQAPAPPRRARAAARLAGAPPPRPSTGRATSWRELPAGAGRCRRCRRPRPDDTTACPRARASIRCSRRSATATRSATRCSASSGCCEAPGYESEIFVETADPAARGPDPRLPRAGRRDRRRTTS